MKCRWDKKYAVAFIVFFVIEAIIAVYVRDNIIRPYVGDILIVVLIYCFLKALIPYKGRLLPLYILVFAIMVEISQYFNLAQILGLGGNKLARIIIGATFDIRDIVCYLLGCLCLFLFELYITRHQFRQL